MLQLLSLNNVLLAFLTQANRLMATFGIAFKPREHEDGLYSLCMDFVGVTTGNYVSFNRKRTFFGGLEDP